MHYYNGQAAAKRIGISYKTLLRWIEKGKITPEEGKTPTGQLVISDDQVEAARKGYRYGSLPGRKVAGIRSFSDLECATQATFARERVPTYRMEMELGPFLVSNSLKSLAICPISGRTSTNSIGYLKFDDKTRSENVKDMSSK